VDQKPAGNAPWDAFGTYLRNQRHLAQLSLRQLADLTKVSNPYLSQIERGLHRPSIAIIKSLAEALNLSTSDLLAHAADIVTDEEPATNTEGAIRNDPFLNDSQKSALLAVYRSMVEGNADGGESREGAGETAGGTAGGSATGSAGQAKDETAGPAPARPKAESRPRSGTRPASRPGTRATRK
jgi:transcriptional regulator with XRE-family HTH domain